MNHLEALKSLKQSSRSESDHIKREALKIYHRSSKELTLFGKSVLRKKLSTIKNDIQKSLMMLAIPSLLIGMVVGVIMTTLIMRAHYREPMQWMIPDHLKVQMENQRFLRIPEATHELNRGQIQLYKISKQED